MPGISHILIVALFTASLERGGGGGDDDEGGGGSSVVGNSGGSRPRYSESFLAHRLLPFHRFARVNCRGR